MSRPRFQQGQILHDGPNWVLRYHEDRFVAGARKRVRTKTVLAPYSEYPYRGTPADIEKLRSLFQDRIQKILAPVNCGDNQFRQTLTLGAFIEQSYFPRLDWRLNQPAGNELHIEPSTIKGYKDIWKAHVQNSPESKVALRDFTSRTGQRFLESLPQTLSHQTHLRIKNFLSGVFTWAIVDGVLTGVNPMDETKAGGQAKKVTATTERQEKVQASNAHAYTLEEVAEMLRKLPDPARTVCAMAAFTGLSRSELWGLKWSDYDGESIQVQRKIWKGQVGVPKTAAREAGVFVISVLRKILAKYKKDFQPAGDGWIFRGEKLLNPLDLDNLSRREIPQHINGAWFGWHAFRRGLGTRLNEAGVDGKTIQSILRHADISTTQAYYIIPDQKRAAAGLKKLDKIVRTKYGIKS
jgi:integrase